MSLWLQTRADLDYPRVETVAITGRRSVKSAPLDEDPRRVPPVAASLGTEKESSCQGKSGHHRRAVPGSDLSALNDTSIAAKGIYDSRRCTSDMVIERRKGYGMPHHACTKE